MRRRTPWILLLALLLPLSARAGEDVTFVVGVGGRVSGRLPVLVVGDIGKDAEAFLAAVPERYGITLLVERRPDLDATARAAALVVLANARHFDVPRIRARLAMGRSFVVALREETGVGGVISRTSRGEHYRLAEAGAPLPAMLDGLRGAILATTAVLHLDSVFGEVTGRVVDGSLRIEAPTQRPGETTMSLLTVEGEEVLVPGPVRPVPLDDLADPDGTLVRLTFRGADGLVDEKRVAVADLLPTPAAGLAVHGSRELVAGEAAAFRAEVADRAGGSRAGVPVRASLAGTRVDAVTDAAGAAVFVFPVPAEPGEGVLLFRADLPDSPVSVRVPIRVVPRPRRLLLSADRPVAEPGGRVRLRALFLDGLDRTAIAGEPVTLEVNDPRGRRFASFDGTTDRFGAATFDLPLAEGIAEGDYRVLGRAGGVESARRLTVESRPRPPFDVEVRLVRTAGGEVRGTVIARTFTGEPIADARVDVAAADATADARLDREGRGAFTLPVAASGTVRVTVSGEGVTAARVVPLPPPAVREPEVRAWCDPWPLVRGVPGEIRLEWDGGARDLDLDVDGERVVRKNVRSPQVVPVVPGADRLVVGAPVDRTFPVVTGLFVRAPASAAPDRPLPFEVFATRRDGPVVVDLVGPAGLLDSLTVTLDDGGAAGAFDPPGRTGDFRIVARGDRPGTADVRIMESELAVRLEPADAEAKPAEETSVRVRVENGTGRGVPALVELRGYDSAWLAEAGDPGPGLGAPPAGRGGPFVALLARVEPVKRREVLEARAAAAAESRDLRLPWGSRFFAARGSWYYDLVGEPAAAGLPWIRRFGGSRAGELPAGIVPVLLPVPAEKPRSRRDDVSRALAWLAAHQEEDGSWGPAEFDPASTGIVLLAYFGAGFTHKHGEYRHTVKNGLLHLKRRQVEGGFFGDEKAPGALLGHAVATLAFTEAYALTASPLFKQTARLGVDALLARQRGDGGFGEEGAAEGSLVLAVWAAHALASARAGGLGTDAARDAEARLTRWLDHRVDPATGIARPSGEEVRRSPFGGLDRPPAPAALTAATRCALARVRGRYGIPTERREIPGVPAIGTGEGVKSLHTLWWGRSVAWRIGGAVWREWGNFSAPALRARQEADGSFAPGVDRIGRPAATALGALCFAFYYRYQRVYGGRVVGGVDPSFGSVGTGPRVRTDFPPLLPLPFTVATDGDGTATVPLALPDSITAWDLRAGAFDGRGGFASARAGIRTTLPVGLDFAAPERLVVGDRLVLFARVRSRREADAKAVVRVAATGGVELTAAAERTIDLPAGAAVAIPIGVTATAAGPASIRVLVRAGADADAIERSIDVRGAGVPFAVSRLFGPGETAGFADRWPAGARDLRARLVVFSGLLADATGALRGLLRRPTGCFEQTSATLYPSLFAYRYLRVAGKLDGAAAARAEENLRVGYQRLLGFETPDGGFSLFPGGTLRADLTALGIHEILDLKAVLPVDELVIRRAAEALARRLPEEPAERIYALAALARAGVPTPPVSVRALVGEDPYRAALAFANGLLGEADREWLHGLFSRTAHRLPSGVEWEPRGSTLFAGGAGSGTETTALVTLALAKLEYGPDLIGGGTSAILAARSPDGAWATTRETVAALRTLVDLGGERPARGTVMIRRPGHPDLAATAGGYTPVEVDLGAWAPEGSVTVDFEGRGAPWSTLVVAGTSDVPAESSGPLAVDVEWPATPARVGGAVAAVVRLANRSDREVYAPLVEVPVPGGLVPDRTALPPRAEVKDGRVYLYLEGLSAGGSVEFRLPFVATFPGRFAPGVASAWPYYEPARVGYDLSVGSTIGIDR